MAKFLIDIPEDLMIRLRLLAIMNQKSTKDLILEILERYANNAKSRKELEAIR